jgi:hypothetical protein
LTVAGVDDEVSLSNAFKEAVLVNRGRSVRHLGSVVAAPLDERGEFRKGESHIRQLYEVDGEFYIASGGKAHGPIVAVAICFVAGFVVSRIWSPVAYAPLVVALIAQLLARRRARRALRYELPSLLEAGKLLRIDQRASGICDSGGVPINSAYNVVVDGKGFRLGVLLGERILEIVAGKRNVAVH